MRRLLWLIVLTGLVACGGQTATVDVAPTATRAAEMAQLATQTRLAELAQLATLAAPTAAPSPTATAAATATPAPTATPFVTATPARTPTPTATLVPPTATPLPLDVPRTGYFARFSRWQSGGQAGRYRASLDPATGEYRLAASSSNFTMIAPESLAFASFALEAEARRIAGPDTGSYGLAFRIQPREPGPTHAVRYAFYVTPQGFFGLNLIKGDGSIQAIQSPAFSRAIKRGDAPNRLTVVCRGERVTLAANGQELGTYPARMVDPGTIGVVVGASRDAQEMEAAFSNLRLFPVGSDPSVIHQLHVDTSGR